MEDNYLESNLTRSSITDTVNNTENIDTTVNASRAPGILGVSPAVENVNNELIYTVDSVKSLKLSKITEQFINSNSNHIIFDFCMDFSLENYDKIKYNKFHERLECFISYINQIFSIDPSKKITIIIRGYWQSIYSKFENIDTRVNMVARQNTRSLPTNITFLKKIY